MGNTEHTSSAPRVGARVPLHDSIPAAPSHPALQPYQMTCIDKHVLAQYVPDTPKEPRPSNSFLLRAYFANCEDVKDLHPPRSRYKMYPQLVQHFKVCLGRDCPGFGREHHSGIGRGGSKGTTPNLYPISYGPG